MTTVSNQSRNNPPATQSRNRSGDITATIIQQINQLSGGFGKYQIRTLVEHSEEFGIYLQQNQLKTNQVRKFLDAVNRIKAALNEIEKELQSKFDDIDEKLRSMLDEVNKSDSSDKERKQKKEQLRFQAEQEKDQLRFQEIESEIVLLKPKLAYAAVRQSSVQALSKVMSAAIDKVYSIDDFHRLVQFLESTIAYHKASGGKD